MLAKVRQQKIIELLNQKQIISLQELADHFSVAVITIRRDLEVLKKDGYVQKVYGGVSLPTSATTKNAEYLARTSSANAEKTAIANTAAQLIKNGETLFLDTGTIVSKLAQNLRNRKDITVVTNSLAVMNVLDGSDVKVYCVGGWINWDQQSLLCDAAESFTENFCFDHYFCGAGGISLEKGVTDYSFEVAKYRRAVLRRSASSVLLVESRKFQKTAPYVVAPLSDFQILITDEHLPDNLQSSLENTELSLQIAK